MTSKQSRPRLFNRACKQCAKARVRCDGAWPCERCNVSETTCERVRKKRSSTSSDHDHTDCAASATSDNLSETSCRMEDSASGDSSSDSASQADLDVLPATYFTPKDDDGDDDNAWHRGERPELQTVIARTASWPMTDYDLNWWPSQTDPVADVAAGFNTMPLQQDPFLDCALEPPPLYSRDQWTSEVGVAECWPPELYAPKAMTAKDFEQYSTAGSRGPIQTQWCAAPVVTFQPIYS
jgi:hypothetical protein